MNSDPTTRPSLLVRLQNSRDEHAWAEFTAIYEPVIYRMTRRRGLQDADAREIVQEVLLSITAAIERFDVDDPGSFRGWLSRITRNATIDRLRQQSARAETIGSSGVARLLDEIVANERLEDEFENDRRRQLFRWAASEVRRRTGELNWMAFWRTSVDGCTVADVAKELGIGEGAVYVARCRILKRIRELVHNRLSE
ncbi:ECF RNA polymerase sigma factor SigW [Novipirellula aureliae]|uniref:ECF RNA polymerase sigma factor SigW n=1 Tax=Novipirellula aureliae TaxID=2527966 RepID=A0A5C6E3Q7_9BACT|nr:sigma-70 family RNA polymerase sigma factor [Novipirellula aureliae]TWU43532.1 ECF RNA polymerase sigma factor SigW [Novipirellula aureliae]